MTTTDELLFWIFCLVLLIWGASDLWDRLHK